MDRLHEALEYEKRRWSVVPLHSVNEKGFCTCKLGSECSSPGKHARIPWKEFQDRRATIEEIQDWWHKWPDANIGLVTGAVSGIIVLDIDGPDGVDTLRQEKLHVPPTIISKTGGGGWHYIYKHPGFDCRNFAGKTGETILPKVDFRGDGGLIVVPPSNHKSGKLYEWGVGPNNTEPENAPAWLIELIKAQGTTEGANRVQPSEWGETVPKGQRNNTLARMAGSLLTKMSETDALPMILAWNKAKCDPPLPEHEVRAVVGSIANREDSKVKTGEEWPEPEKLEITLEPVATLPEGIIPEAFRPWLTDIAQRMQCPLDFVAVGALVVAGSIIGAGCGIRPKRRDDWLVIPNLWGGIIARPSMMKTPSLSEVMRPLKRLEVEAKQTFEDELMFSQAEAEVFKAQRDALKSQMVSAAKGNSKVKKTMEQLRDEFLLLDEPTAPTRRRYVTNDPTIEKMAELLNENPRGILYFRDELVGLLLNLDREDRQSDRAFYLEAWNGYGSYTTDRIGRGTIDTGNMCVSILGGIQPSKLLGYLFQAKDNLQNDGLLQRFQLLVYPDEPSEWKLVDEYPDKEARERAFVVFQTLAETKFEEWDAEQEGERIFLRFTNDAQNLFNVWLTDLQEKLQTEEDSLMVEHLSKYRSLMPSLALILHLIGVADGQANGPVSLLAAQQAAAWCEYLESHARRIFGMGARAELKAAQALAEKIKAGQVVDGFTPRDVYNNNWHSLTNRESVQEATRELVEAGWLRKEKIKTGGRPSTRFRLNPKIMDT